MLGIGENCATIELHMLRDFKLLSHGMILQAGRVGPGAKKSDFPCG